MALLETWRKLAYETEMNQKQASEFWGGYFQLEKGIYENILSTPDTVVKGTVKELADKFGVEVLIMAGLMVSMTVLRLLILLRQWKRIQKYHLITIRKSSTITW
jgi:hypothetical protein